MVCGVQFYIWWQAGGHPPVKKEFAKIYTFPGGEGQDESPGGGSDPHPRQGEPRPAFPPGASPSGDLYLPSLQAEIRGLEGPIPKHLLAIFLKNI